MVALSVSLVTYHPDRLMLAETLASLQRAVTLAHREGWLGDVDLTIVDNGNDVGLIELAEAAGWPKANLITGHGNVGFGRGHNLAFASRMHELHLIMNPDVELQPDALCEALKFMAAQADCGLLSPAVRGKDGEWAYLCKRYPSLFDLFLRGFMPASVKRLFASHLARYEMADCPVTAVLWDPPILSGCFMLCRRSLLQALEGFDPRFFLYFEDFDISLRAAQKMRLAAVGTVRILHHGGDAGRKGWAHVRMFGVSAARFFGKHGWRVI